MTGGMTGEAIDRTPPHNIEAEQAVLGSMLLEHSALETGLEMLTPSDFYRPVHQLLFEALQALAGAGKEIDIITLTELLRERGKLKDCGGAEYLMSLVSSVPTAANIEYYASIVAEHSTRRRLIAAGSQVIAAAYRRDADLHECVAEAESAVFAVAQDRVRSGIVPMSDAYRAAYEHLEHADGQIGVPIGLRSLAHISLGMRPRELIVIGARPRVGKTALAWQLLVSAAKAGYPAAIVSCEMDAEELAMRDIARETGMSIYRMLSGDMDGDQWARIGEAISVCYGLPLYCVDAIGWRMERIASACRRLVRQGVRIIAIDHLQAIEPDDLRQSRAVQVERIVYHCKALARRLNIPILALCQFNRDIERRGRDARPVLADLKESGAVEQYADVIWLLWRSMDETDTRPVSEAEIIVAKQRMLRPGVVRCAFEGRKFRFLDLDTHHDYPRGEESEIGTATRV